MEKLEDMMISLGLADTRRAVAILAQDAGCGEDQLIDFEDLLTIVRTSKGDSDIFSVFKEMIDGRLSEGGLNFKNVISTYRRKVMLDAVGIGKSPTTAEQEHGAKILHNFASLHRSRYDDATKIRMKYAKNEENEEAFEDVSTAEPSASSRCHTQPPSPVSQPPSPATTTLLPFDANGGCELGGLELLWREACDKENLRPEAMPSSDTNPNTAVGSGRHRLQRRGSQMATKPLTPGAIMNNVMKSCSYKPDPLVRRVGKPGRQTLIVREESASNVSRPASGEMQQALPQQASSLFELTAADPGRDCIVGSYSAIEVSTPLSGMRLL